MLPARNVPPITGKALDVARMLGVSASQVRRLSREDPDFPRPIRFVPRGDYYWVLADVAEYVTRKRAAGRLDAA